MIRGLRRDHRRRPGAGLLWGAAGLPWRRKRRSERRSEVLLDSFFCRIFAAVRARPWQGAAEACPIGWRSELALQLVDSDLELELEMLGPPIMAFVPLSRPCNLVRSLELLSRVLVASRS